MIQLARDKRKRSALAKPFLQAPTLRESIFFWKFCPSGSSDARHKYSNVELFQFRNFAAVKKFELMSRNPSLNISFDFVTTGFAICVKIFEAKSKNFLHDFCIFWLIKKCFFHFRWKLFEFFLYISACYQVAMIRPSSDGKTQKCEVSKRRRDVEWDVESELVKILIGKIQKATRIPFYCWMLYE